MAVFNNKQRIMPVYQVDDTGTTLPSRASETTLSNVLAAVGNLTTPADTQPVSVAALPLPAGAATEATVAGLLTDAELRATPVPVSGPLTNTELRASAVAISAAALPLPAGAATEATLATRATEATLTAISAKLPASLGAKTPGASFSVVDAIPAEFTLVAPSVQLGNGKSLLSLVNAASGVVLRIKRIYAINVQTSSVTGVAAELQLRRVTGHSAGTLLTPEAHDLNDVLNVGVTARTGGTVSGEASTYLNRGWWASDEWGPGTADVESFDHTMQTLLPAWGGYVLRNGQGLSVRCNTNTANGTFDIVIVFTAE